MKDSASIRKECYNAIGKFAELSSNSSNVNFVANKTLTDIADIFDLSIVRIYERSDDSYNFHFIFSSENKENLNLNSTVHISREILFNNFDVEDKYRCFNGLEKIKNNIMFKDFHYDFQSALFIPIFYHGYMLGGCQLTDCKKERNWSKEDISSLNTILHILLLYLFNMNAFSFIVSNSYKFDHLTGLPKREYALEKLQTLLNNKSNNINYAVVCFDIHSFKYINDRFGTGKGDSILIETARYLLSNTHIDDICRQHSDNFSYVLYFKDNENPKDIISDINNKLYKNLKKDFPEINLKFTTGYYIITDIKVQPEKAYEYANEAKHISKEIGNFPIVKFENTMMDKIQREEYLNSKFDESINNRNFVVFYQPKVSCMTEKVIGSEALIRWFDNDGKIIFPSDFIPTFEKNGNVIKLDYFVYRETFAHIKKRLDNGLPVVPVSMNVSRLHLKDDDIFRYIRELFDEYKIPPKYVEFELTENIYMENLEKANDFVNFCRDMDVFVSIDDFGSGYSSLNMIDLIRANVLKIDKAFFKNDILKEEDKIVIECIVNLAKKLKMKIICEGVETREQSDFLRSIECDAIQGYYYSKPMPENEFDEYVENHI